MFGYHFVGDALRDGRPIPADGEWLEHEGPLVMCESGLHWSKHPMDALRYALGFTLCLVEVDGDCIEDGDKCVSRRRRIVKRIDAAALLRGFARWQAFQVLRLWKAPAVVADYLATGHEGIRAAAGDAAGDAARAAAVDAAWAAARAAAGDATWAAARAADAAGDAAWAAAWAGAKAAAKDDFELLVDMAFDGWECAK